MGRSRILILLIAIATGGAAFFLVASGDRSAQSVQEVVPAKVGPEMVEVLVAEGDLQRGSILNSEAIRWIDFPKSSVPEHYITKDNQEFIEALALKRTRRLVRAREPLNLENTVQHGDRGLMAAILTPGMRAVAMLTKPEESSGGFVLPGDRVDVFASGFDENGNQTISTMILQDVRVLAIDQAHETDEDSTALVGKTVTLEISPDEVDDFLKARSTMGLTIVLRSLFEGEVETRERMRPDEVIIVRYGQG